MENEARSSFTERTAVDANENHVRNGETPAAGLEQRVCGGGEKTLAQWKQEQKESTRDKLREEYAAVAAKLVVGDKCEVGGHVGEVSFVGQDVEGLPGGAWVGIRFVEPVGKNDGMVKGLRLFMCQPNHGLLVRPDKVSVTRPSRTPRKDAVGVLSAASENMSPSQNRPSSSGGSRPTTPSAGSSSPANFYNPEKLQHGDPDKIIGSDKRIEDIMPRNRVGLVYDERMGGHRATCGYHPEQPARIKAIFCKLEQQGLAQRCVRVPARPATVAELRSVHTEKHVQAMVDAQGLAQEELDSMCKELDSVFMCPESAKASLLAAGGVIEATKRVSTGMIKRAVCVVRPPGHHAEPDCAMGFCLFGNVAIAAREARRHGWAKKVLIVDWDAHHGNGTQRMFLDDPSVLFVSIHRFDRGAFYPGGPDGDYTTAGQGAGAGFSINVPWPKSGAGDAEYMAAFDQVVMPAAEEFQPDLVLVSAGFDSAAGDPLGGCKVSPEAYNWMTYKLLTLANGRLVLALEGGYSLRSISVSISACLSAMLGDAPMAPTKDVQDAAKVHMDVIEQVRAFHAQYWRCFAASGDVDQQRLPMSSPSPSNISSGVSDMRCAEDKMRSALVSPPTSIKGNAGSYYSSSSTPEDPLHPACDSTPHLKDLVGALCLNDDS